MRELAYSNAKPVLIIGLENDTNHKLVAIVITDEGRLRKYPVEELVLPKGQPSAEEYLKQLRQHGI